jgi:D-sedoheptulose 7-phosphate isomerase
MAENLSKRVRAHLDGHRELFSRLDDLDSDVQAIAQNIAETLSAGGRVYLAGNGGSAADAQHIAAEMEGRYLVDRPARAVHTLGANTSTLTSIGNDDGYHRVYARQIEGFVGRSDLIILISTSGNSPNLLSAAESARAKGVPVIGLLGRGGGPLLSLCDKALVVPSDHTPWIQEAHITLGHLICELCDVLMGPS